MLIRLHRIAPPIALLVCVALLAAWLTGSHAHRHVGGQEHGHTLHAWAGTDSGREHGHSHELDSSRATAAGLASAEHGQAAHLGFHSVSLIHQDGHENIELQALQPPPGKTQSDLPMLAVFCGTVLALTRTRTAAVAALIDPPDPERVDWSLRPPLRGPPSFSVV